MPKKAGDGFGNTWFTNWRRAAEVPARTLVFVFVVTAAGVAVGDYFISGRESAWLSIGLGLGCGLIVTRLAQRKMRTYPQG